MARNITGKAKRSWQQGRPRMEGRCWAQMTLKWPSDTSIGPMSNHRWVVQAVRWGCLDSTTERCVSSTLSSTPDSFA